VLEGVMSIFVTAILMAGLALLGHSVMPVDPLSVFEAFLGLWLFGLGFGLITSVIAELVPEIGRVIHLIMLPLMILSGVMLPLAVVPQPYRDWLMLNPVAHGLEAARLGFAPHYHAVEELSIAYLFGFALVSIFLGLALHRRYALRLISQ
jgi:capsular polysaccharide transport system permease protein